jgi:lipopolysaccharide biosynthesis glycosyltransferase
MADRSVASHDLPLRLVTMADDSYLPGLATLLHSLDRNSNLGSVPMTVIYDGVIHRDVQDVLSPASFEIEFIPREELGHVPARAFTRGRRQSTLQKLLVFRLPYEEKLAFLDADMVCLRSISAVRLMEPVSVVAEHKMYNLALDDSTPVFNSGFFVFKADASLTDELCAFYSEDERQFPLGDQMVLNQYIHLTGALTRHFVSDVWNMPTTGLCAERDRPIDDIRLLHFVGHKPWLNMWRPYTGTNARMAKLYELWWAYFKQTDLWESLQMKHPPFWLIHAAHSAAARPMWNSARRLSQLMPRLVAR